MRSLAVVIFFVFRVTLHLAEAGKDNRFWPEDVKWWSKAPFYGRVSFRGLRTDRSFRFCWLGSLKESLLPLQCPLPFLSPIKYLLLKNRTAQVISHIDVRKHQENLQTLLSNAIFSRATSVKNKFCKITIIIILLFVLSVWTEHLPHFTKLQTLSLVQVCISCDTVAVESKSPGYLCKLDKRLHLISSIEQDPLWTVLSSLSQIKLAGWLMRSCSQNDLCSKKSSSNLSSYLHTSVPVPLCLAAMFAISLLGG